MNRIMLTGRLTKDPELKQTGNGVSVLGFTLAVNRDFKNDKGVYEADFINCVAYRTVSELINKYVKKGDRLAVEGRLQVRNYDNNEGKKVYVTEVIVNNIEFLESRTEKKEPAETKKDPFEEFGNSVKADQLDLPF